MRRQSGWLVYAFHLTPRLVLMLWGIGLPSSQMISDLQFEAVSLAFVTSRVDLCMSC